MRESQSQYLDLTDEIGGSSYVTGFLCDSIGLLLLFLYYEVTSIVVDEYVNLDAQQTFLQNMSQTGRLSLCQKITVTSMIAS